MSDWRATDEQARREAAIAASGRRIMGLTGAIVLGGAAQGVLGGWGAALAALLHPATLVAVLVALWWINDPPARG